MCLFVHVKPFIVVATLTVIPTLSGCTTNTALTASPKTMTGNTLDVSKDTKPTINYEQPMNNTIKKPKIFLIHGIFMHGIVMTYMRVQLEKLGYDVKVFSYSSTRETMSNNAEKLVEFVKANSDDDDVRHFVGHSLGGLLIRLSYEIAPDLFTGKIATLGTPHNGSLVAHSITTNIHPVIIGGAFHNALDGNLPDWRGDVPLGSISGTSRLGLGLVIPSLQRPSDGTVSVAETQLTNQTDHIEISKSHTMLVYSKLAIQQVDAFLKTGQFIHTVPREE